MKKLFVSILCLVFLAVSVSPTFAQKQRCKNKRSYNSDYYGRSYNQGRQYRTRYYRDNRSWWSRHRDKATVGIGAGAGAAIGGLTGGKKGAVIGALLGAGGGALYTYKLRDRKKRHYRRY